MGIIENRHRGPCPTDCGFHDIKNVLNVIDGCVVSHKVLDAVQLVCRQLQVLFRKEVSILPKNLGRYHDRYFRRAQLTLPVDHGFVIFSGPE